MKLLIGTKNPVKIEAVKEAFEKYFSEVETEERSVESIITKNKATRTELIKNAVIMALTKHINGEIWQ